MAGTLPIGGPLTWMSDDSGPDRGPKPVRGLIVAAQSGDTAAFGSLVEVHQHKVFRTARSILGNDADAEDAAQETFLRAFRHMASFDAQRDVSAWLYKLTVNACLDVIRRRPRSEAAETDTQAAVSPDIGPYKERAAITLRDLEGLSTAEVAAALGTTEATVRSQVSAGRAKLRRYILGEKRSKP